MTRRAATARGSGGAAQRLRVVLLVAIVAAAAACTGGSGSSGAASGSGGASGATPLTVGLGYIPSVQFAQFYLADQAGYYRDAGLQVTFQNRIDPDLITLLGQGQIDIGMADGTSLIPAVSQGIPVRYVATVYGTFPNVVLASEASGIRTTEDLRGKRLGIPGKFGSSWIMLQALLASAGLTPNDLDVRTYPDFGQAAALQQGAVDAATGFANNEPVQLGRNGVPVTLLRVGASTPLPGPGLSVGARTLETKRDAVRAFVTATLRAMREIEADPQKGLDAAIAHVPELGADREAQLAVLRATIEGWHAPGGTPREFGRIDREGWARSVEFMRTLPDGPVPNPVTVDQLVTEELLDG